MNKTKKKAKRFIYTDDDLIEVTDKKKSISSIRLKTFKKEVKI